MRKIQNVAGISILTLSLVFSFLIVKADDPVPTKKGIVKATICCSNNAIIGYASNCKTGTGDCAEQQCNLGTEIEATSCPKP